MKTLIEMADEISDSASTGLIVYSTEKNEISAELNKDLILPLASAAKVAIGFSVAKWVETGVIDWSDQVEDVTFNPAEDSHELYPHLQSRTSLSLAEAVEVIIACHDSSVAGAVVEYCGGWDKVNRHLQKHFTNINVTEDPRHQDNKGCLNDVFNLLLTIYHGYQSDPTCWLPVINGLVRQRGGTNKIPLHMLNHMTGGLPHALIDIGLIGKFDEHPLIYIIGAKGLPDRNTDQAADQRVERMLEMIYEEHLS